MHSCPDTDIDPNFFLIAPIDAQMIFNLFIHPLIEW